LRESGFSSAKSDFLTRASALPLPFDRINGTDIVAGAAFGADLLVDDVHGVAGTDGAHRTDWFTGATGDAFVGDIVGSHAFPPSWWVLFVETTVEKYCSV